MGQFVAKWGKIAVFGFLDQGLFSTTNFCINILLARWLQPREYGAFAVAYSIYIFLATIHSGLITEPMLVYGSLHREDLYTQYIGVQIRLHFYLSIALSAVIGCLGILLGSSLKSAILGAAIATPFTLCLWLFRRVGYIKQQTHIAFILSSVYSIVVVSGMLLLKRHSILAPYFVFILMGIASLISSVIALFIFKVNVKWRTFFTTSVIGDPILLENWHFGKWVTAANIADGVANMIYVPLIGLFSNLETAAALRSMQNLVLPLQQVQSVMCLMALPWLSRKLIERSPRTINKYYIPIITLFLAPSLIYIGLLLSAGQVFSSILYQNSFYTQYVWLIPLISVSLIFSTLSLATSVVLRAIKKSEPLLWSKIGSMILVLTLGIGFIYLWGLNGVIMSIYMSVLVELIILLVVWGKQISQRARS